MEFVPSTAELIQAIKTYERKTLDDLRPFWRTGGKDAVIEEMARLFVTEGNGTWAPLSGRYKAWKSKHYPGKTVLRRTDAYFRSVAWKRENTGGNYARFETDFMEWGVNEEWFASKFGYPYPVAHEEGRGNLPKRPVFALAEQSVQLQNRLTRSFTKWLHKDARAYLGKIFNVQE